MGRSPKLALPADPDTTGIRRLTATDEQAILELYRASYPGNWFHPEVLTSGRYYGHWTGNRLTGIAGTHVYSPAMRVAALGNVTTHPDFRGRGIARRVCRALCLDLQDTTDLIGLNVKADNAAAIHCYQTLGFEIAAEYEEWHLEKR